MSTLTPESLIARIDGLQDEIASFINEYPSLNLDTASFKFLPELATCLELIREQVNDKDCKEVKSHPLFMLYGTRSKDLFLEEVFDTAQSVKDRVYAEKLTDELHEFLDRIKKLDDDIWPYNGALTNQRFENLPKNRVKEGIKDYITQQIIEPETGEVWDFFHGYFGLEYDEPNSDLCDKVEAYVKEVAQRVIEEM